MSLILKLFESHGIQYKKSGSSIVCRCPICKGDSKLASHNAQVNTDTNSLYCFSEQKLYTYAELLKELGNDVENIILKRKNQAIENTQRTKTNIKKFDEVKSSLIEKGYSVVAVYEYYDLDGQLVYERYRFEKENNDGTKDKILLPRSVDGYASLKGQKQIPYRLDQFLYIHSDEIWLCEGEKCTDAVIANMPDSANLTVLGFTKPSDLEGFESLFENKKVVIFQDNDSTGKKNTKDLIELLKTHAKTIRVVKFSEFGQGYDVADFLEQFDWNELIERVENAEVVYQTPTLQLYQGIIETIEQEKLFVLEPFIPNRSIILFDGLGETGKSLFAIQLCLCISENFSFLNLAVNAINEPQRVLYFTAEETEFTFNERLKKICKGLKISNPKNFYWIFTLSSRFTCSTYRILESGKKIEKTEFYDYVKSILSQIKPKLVVFDSLVNFFGLEENSSEHASVFIETLKLLAKDHDCSFLLLHHQTKEAMKRDGEKIFRGSMVFREQARCRFTIEKVNDNTKKITIEKLNQYTMYPREFYVKLATVDENLEPCLCFIPSDPLVTTVQKRKNVKKDEIEEVF